MLAQYSGEETGKVFGTQVKYLDSAERQQFKLTIHNGKLHTADGNLFDTTAGTSLWTKGGGRAIFVMDHNGDIYASNYQEKGKFHHSSFLAGAPVASAGELEVRNGELVAMSPQSGHYRPSGQQLLQCANHLLAQGVPGRFNVETTV